MKPNFSKLALGLVFAVAGTAATAQEVCMSGTEMKAALIDWYGERPVDEPGADRQQLWASPTTGTWTMVEHFADGRACVVAQGGNWMAGMSEDKLVASLEQ